jgi:hypothetical protein
VCKQLQKKEGVLVLSGGWEGGVWLLALDAGRFSLHLTAARRHGNQESAPLAEHYLPKILNFVCGHIGRASIKLHEAAAYYRDGLFKFNNLIHR